MSKQITKNHLRGTVDHLFFSSPTFSAGRLKLSKDQSSIDLYKPVSFTAPVQLSVGETVTLHGSWKTHDTYGEQFIAKQVEHDLNLDADGLALWLEKNKDIKGIGTSKARLIANTFGEDFDRVIMNEPQRVADLAHLNPNQIETLQTVWKEYRANRELITWLAAFGLSKYEIDVLLEKYGSNTYSVLRSDPYLIVGALPRFAFKKADKIALRMGVPKDFPSRIKHGLLWVVRDTQNDGHTYLLWDQLIDKANVLLELDGLNSRNVIAEYAADVKGMWIGRLPSLVSDNPEISDKSISVVGDERMIDAEKYLAQFAANVSPSPHEKDFVDIEKPAIRSMITTLAPQLNEDQATAVQNAMLWSISLISGGAGTGKTYTVSTIKRLYEENGLIVTLCAPTGKAARRLAETTNGDAQTIHRLLGYNGHQYLVDNVPTDLLVIDEFSMVDSRLAFELFSRVDMTKTTVVIVGDHNQLPPVGPGNMLRDLIESGVIPTTILRNVVRQAGVLKRNSTAILSGAVAPTSEKNETGHVPWQVVDGNNDSGSCAVWVKSVVGKLSKDYPDLDLVHGMQILAPIKDGDLGVKRLNVELQRIVQRVRYGREVEDYASDLVGSRAGGANKSKKKYLSYRYFPEDKIIQIQNDYKLGENGGVMNGTLGQIVETSDESGARGSLLIQFEGESEPVQVDMEKRKNIALAYVLTIHKAQGSEFPYVILIIHKSHSFVHNRSILYTGATRAQKKLTIVGDTWGIRNCAAKTVVDKRQTWLSVLLRQAAKG